MTTMSQEVKGLRELGQFLDALPAKLEKNILRSSLRTGMKGVMERAKETAPKGPASYEALKQGTGHAGALAETIRMATSVKGGKVAARVIVGGKYKGVDAWYAHILEYAGAIAHFIGPMKGNRFLFINGQRIYGAVWHPGMKAQPFFRRALEAGAQQAIADAAAYMRKRLTKQDLNASYVKLEGDE